MQKRRSLIALISIVTLLAGAVSAQEATKQKRSTAMAAAGSEPVIGSGTPGRISKWSGVFGTETYSLGNSNIVNPAAFHNAGANYRYFDGTSIEVFTFAADDADDTKDNSFTIILY